MLKKTGHKPSGEQIVMLRKISVLRMLYISLAVLPVVHLSKPNGTQTLSFCKFYLLSSISLYTIIERLVAYVV